MVAFAARQPGALTAFFLSMLHQRASQGLLTRTKQLRAQSVVQWVTSHCGLQEVRDQREALTLAAAMDSINSRQLATAMDTLAQRLQALQSAKAKGGSWEKASKIELTSTGGSLAGASGLQRLTA